MGLHKKSIVLESTKCCSHDGDKHFVGYRVDDTTDYCPLTWVVSGDVAIKIVCKSSDEQCPPTGHTVVRMNNVAQLT